MNQCTIYISTSAVKMIKEQAIDEQFDAKTHTIIQEPYQQVMLVKKITRKFLRKRIKRDKMLL